MTDATPYPIPRSVRQTDLLYGNGGTVYGPFSFKIFDEQDVEVWARPYGSDNFSKVAAAVTKVSGQALDNFTVTLATALLPSAQFVVRAARVAERSAGVKSGTKIDPTALEKEFSKVATTLQELRRDLGRAVLSDFGQVPLSISADVADGEALMRRGNALVGGPDIVALAAGAEQMLAQAEILLQQVQAAADVAAIAAAQKVVSIVDQLVRNLIAAQAVPEQVTPFDGIGNGAATVFPLPIAPPSSASVIVAVGGIDQAHGAYSIDGNTIVFSEPIPDGVPFSGRIVSRAVTVIDMAAGSVDDDAISLASRTYKRNRDFVLATDEIPLSAFDGVTNVSSALQSLLNRGKKVLIPATAKAMYLGTATLDFSAGGSLVGMDGRPAKLKTGAAAFLNAVGLVNVTLFENLSIEGRNASTTYQFRMTSCENIRMYGVELFNLDSGFDLLDCIGFRIEDVFMHEYRGTGFKLRGGCRDFTFRSPKFINGGSFSIFGDTGAGYGDAGPSDVSIYDIFRSYDPSALISGTHDYLIADSDIANGRLGIEAVGARYTCLDWQVFGGIIEHVDENSISFTGNRCLATGVRIRNGRGTGIHLYGQWSQASNNRISGCTTGVGSSANAGGIGRDHIVEGNQIDTCTYGVRANAGQYAAWNAGGGFSGEYCTYASGGTTRIYYRVSGGSVFGASAPTHSSGDVSDGLNVWRYCNSVPEAQGLDSRGHVITGNRLRSAPIHTSSIGAGALAACLIDNNLET